MQIKQFVRDEAINVRFPLLSFIVCRFTLIIKRLCLVIFIPEGIWCNARIFFKEFYKIGSICKI